MVDIAAIAGTMSSLKSLKDIAEAMVGLRDAEAFQLKRFELQSKIIDAQASVFAANDERAALIEKVDQLEAEIARLKDWEAEKQRYELKHVSHIGTLAYVTKPGQENGEPPHRLCARCYQTGKKALLQPTTELDLQMRVYACQECGSTIVVSSMPR